MPVRKNVRFWLMFILLALACAYALTETDFKETVKDYFLLADDVHKATIYQNILEGGLFNV